jgi:morphogenesis family protein
VSTVHIEWHPDPIVFSDAILTVADALRDPTPALLAARDFTQEDIRERFLTETAPDGSPWAQWAESYADRAEAYPNIGILRQTEELYDEAAGSDAFIVSHDTVFYDSSAMPERGIWHQEGRPERRTKGGASNPLPARPFLGLSEATRTLIFATFADWFDRSIDLFVTARGRMGRQHAILGTHPATGHKGFIPRSSPMPGRLRTAR